MGFFSAYRSVFDDYPSLRTMVGSALPKIPSTISTALLQLGKLGRATKFTDIHDQHAFLDEKVTQLVRFS